MGWRRNRTSIYEIFWALDNYTFVSKTWKLKEFQNKKYWRIWKNIYPLVSHLLWRVISLKCQNLVEFFLLLNLQ